MGSCISCKTRHRRFAQSGQPIRRIKVRKRDEFTRTVELYKLEFIDLCLIFNFPRNLTGGNGGKSSLDLFDVII